MKLCLIVSLLSQITNVAQIAQAGPKKPKVCGGKQDDQAPKKKDPKLSQKHAGCEQPNVRPDDSQGQPPFPEPEATPEHPSTQIQMIDDENMIEGGEEEERTDDEVMEAVLPHSDVAYVNADETQAEELPMTVEESDDETQKPATTKGTFQDRTINRVYMCQSTATRAQSKGNANYVMRFFIFMINHAGRSCPAISTDADSLGQQGFDVASRSGARFFGSTGGGSMQRLREHYGKKRSQLAEGRYTLTIALS